MLILFLLSHSFFSLQKRKQGRITFDTMDFVAEEVCVTLTLLLGIFFLPHGLEEALNWVSEQLGPVRVLAPNHCIILN